MLIVEREYSSYEVLESQRLYDDLVISHSDCNGTGLSVVKDQVNDCICEQTYKYLLELVYARLPKGFWDVSIKQLKSILHNDHSDLAYELLNDFKLFSGLVIGSALSGKSSLLTIIGKLAILNNQSVLYMTPEDILQYSKFDADKLIIERMMGVDIVLIDGLENYNTQYENQTLIIEQTLQKLLDKGTRLLITTGLLPEHFKVKFSDRIISFLKKLPLDLITDLKKSSYKDLAVNNYLDSELSKEAIRFKPGY